jgi:N-sulfoglucosamine sulfohydrolase
VSFAPVLQNPRAVVRDYAFAEHNWHVYAAHERMVRHAEWLYIRNAWPERQTLSVESDATFPAGRELWDAHAAGRTNADQRDVFLKPRPPEELYNVERDAHQLQNLAGDARHAATLKPLRAVLDRWTRETGDTVPGNPTPDRAKGRQATKGELPGEKTGATRINHPGPVRR